jgi:hypothetical protein
MKKVVSYLLIIFLAILIPFTAITGIVLLYPDYYQNSYARSLALQYNYLKETQNTQRIVFIGTSSLVFGIDVDMVEKEFKNKGYNAVVLFGSYGAIGNECILDWTRKYITPGDLVIYMYDMYDYAMNPYFSSTLTIEGTFRNYEMFSDLNSRDKCQYLAHLPTYMKDNIYSYNQTKRPRQYRTCYTITSFDEKGRLTYFRESNTMGGINKEEQTICYISPSMINPEWTSYINDWADELRENRAVVYFSYGPMDKDLCMHKDTTKESVEAFCSEWEEQIGIESINNMWDCYLPDSYFYDSVYHLNSYGAQYFTSYMIRNIEMQIYGETNYEIVIPSEIA